MLNFFINYNNIVTLEDKQSTAKVKLNPTND